MKIEPATCVIFSRKSVSGDFYRLLKGGRKKEGKRIVRVIDAITRKKQQKTGEKENTRQVAANRIDSGHSRVRKVSHVL